MLLLLCSSSATAATPNSAITGRVMSGGAPAAGVTVTVTSPALLSERTTITTSTGRYWLGALPPGRYDVTFARAKLQSLTRRVLVELARVSRADAVLEPSEDEESVTSTAIPLTVSDTVAITSHFSDETFDRLPIRRDVFSAVLISPGPFAGLAGFINGAIDFAGDSGLESLEQVTVIRAAVPADHDAGPTLFTAQTRSGGEDYFFSLRDTISNGSWIATDFPNFAAYEKGLEQTVELNAGGRIIKDRLWFFAGAWNGSEALYGDRTGYEAKLTWQPAAQHNLAAFFTEGEVGTPFFSPDSTIASLRYTGTAGPRWTNQAVLSRTTSFNSPVAVPVPLPRFRTDSLFARTSYVAGNHVLSAGGRAFDNSFDGDVALFVTDRWAAHRFTIDAGVRHENDGFMPRVAASFDVRGNGRQAITASYSDYGANHSFVLREQTLGFATAVGTTGSIRVDAFRRDHDPGDTTGAMGEFRYSLFDRFHTGASYTWTQTDAELLTFAPSHIAHAWAGVDFPIGEHEGGITAMQHYRSPLRGLTDSAHQTDLALRYSLPVSRLALTLALDVHNIFDTREDVFALGRSFRAWIRLRLG